MLTACQPVPKPFSNGNAASNDLLTLTDGQGIMVLPLTDSAGAPQTQLTAPMVQALHEQNIPAAYDSGSRSSFLLSGQLSAPPAPPALMWVLKTPQGQEIGRTVQPLEVGGGKPSKLRDFAAYKRAAAELAAFIQDELPSDSTPPPLHVGKVSGAPGDGNSRLRAAIEQLLPRTGLKLVPRATPESLVVIGHVTIDPTNGREQRVEIAWTVRDPFGTEVGTIAQGRPVAVGSLNADWGLIANEAALAGATGIAEMVRQIDWSQGFQPLLN